MPAMGVACLVSEEKKSNLIHADYQNRRVEGKLLNFFHRYVSMSVKVNVVIGRDLLTCVHIPLNYQLFRVVSIVRDFVN